MEANGHLNFSVAWLSEKQPPPPANSCTEGKLAPEQISTW
jgi:hypothetical protein